MTCLLSLVIITLGFMDKIIVKPLILGVSNAYAMTYLSHISYKSSSALSAGRGVAPHRVTPPVARSSANYLSFPFRSHYKQLKKACYKSRTVTNSIAHGNAVGLRSCQPICSLSAPPPSAQRAKNTFHGLPTALPWTMELFSVRDLLTEHLKTFLETLDCKSARP
jgi:hypothetical protein